jgi:hypothetical protein
VRSVRARGNASPEAEETLRGVPRSLSERAKHVTWRASETHRTGAFSFARHTSIDTVHHFCLTILCLFPRRCGTGAVTGAASADAGTESASGSASGNVEAPSRAAAISRVVAPRVPRATRRPEGLGERRRKRFFTVFVKIVLHVFSRLRNVSVLVSPRDRSHVHNGVVHDAHRGHDALKPTLA